MQLVSCLVLRWLQRLVSSWMRRWCWADDNVRQLPLPGDERLSRSSSRQPRRWPEASRTATGTEISHSPVMRIIFSSYVYKLGLNWDCSVYSQNYGPKQRKSIHKIIGKIPAKFIFTSKCIHSVSSLLTIKQFICTFRVRNADILKSLVAKENMTPI